jgi:REP element-mobilizing transposase RayT
MKTNDIDSLNHTSWNCKCHIVFAPKYRGKVAYVKMRVEIGKILRELCNWKQVEIIEAEVCPDHIHMLVKIPPKMSVTPASSTGHDETRIYADFLKVSKSFGERYPSFSCKRMLL